jgi:hypothetical protein
MVLAFSCGTLPDAVLVLGPLLIASGFEDLSEGKRALDVVCVPN